MPDSGLNAGLISYTTSAVMFFGLTALLVTSWRGRLQGWLLVVACAATTLWATGAAVQAFLGYPPMVWVPLFEAVRNAAWFAFLIGLLNPSALGATTPTPMPTRLRLTAWVLGGACVLLVMLVWVQGFSKTSALGIEAYVFILVVLAVAGLGLVEQVFRNTRLDQRWGIKYLCLAVGGMFAYDFFVFSHALLLKQMDLQLWNARGFIAALAALLIGVSATRNPQWSMEMLISRRMVFHTAALLGAGIYLLVMAAGGYYIRLYGGSWGAMMQAIFLFGAILMLLIVMSSGQVRARVKVFFNKHFFKRKYDYREEWLHFTRTLAGGASGPQVRQRAIEAIAGLVDSPGGQLWWRRGVSGFVPVERWNAPASTALSEPSDSGLSVLLATRGWIVNVDECIQRPQACDGLVLPAWLRELHQAWLVVPLLLHQEVCGFVVLLHSRADRPLNWEDRDLLKTAGSQAAGYLAQWESSEALTEARQFEAFSRLSAFVVHDLKNLVAQLSLVVSNAARHKHNPAFMEDAILTVDHSVGKMNRLLVQLRRGAVTTRNATTPCDLDELLRDAVKAAAHGRPVPLLERSEAGLKVRAERERLLAILGHLLQNAQHATPVEGKIRVRLYREGEVAVIEIEDNGCGMEADFIRERLFRPFQSTKGEAGMGIGVYQSREVVRELGGEITVHSEAKQGTLFRIRLPFNRHETQHNAQGMDI